MSPRDLSRSGVVGVGMLYTKVIKVSDKVYEELQELTISFRVTPSRRCVATKVGKSCLVECGDGS